jgi:hypothetical protein
MRVYKLKDFARAARKNGIGDDDLREAVRRAERGLTDGDLGKFLIKQRIARLNEGRSGGFRAILVHRKGGRPCFCISSPRAGRPT